MESVNDLIEDDDLLFRLSSNVFKTCQLYILIFHLTTGISLSQYCFGNNLNTKQDYRLQVFS